MDEMEVLEAEAAEGARISLLRQFRIGRGAGISHGATDDETARQIGERIADAGAQARDDKLGEILECVAVRVEYRAAEMQARGVGLDRLQKARVLGRLEISLNRPWPGLDAAPLPRLALGAEGQGGAGGGAEALAHIEHHRARGAMRIRHREDSVGRAEVEPERARSGGAGHAFAG